MPVTAIIYATRKQGVTPAEFKKHYEESHVPLVKSISGYLFPKSHTRFYVQRTHTGDPSDKPNKGYPATVLVGGQEAFDYDAYAELVFEDMQAFQQFMGCVTQPEAAKKIAEDEEKFLERSKMIAALVDDVKVTT